MSHKNVSKRKHRQHVKRRLRHQTESEYGIKRLSNGDLKRAHTKRHLGGNFEGEYK